MIKMAQIILSLGEYCFPYHPPFHYYVILFMTPSFWFGFKYIIIGAKVFQNEKPFSIRVFKFLCLFLFLYNI